MSGFAVQGWCPDAWHPMQAGDGLLMRVRPRLGRLSRAQTGRLCAVANTYGNGQIDLTNRANLQVRGVSEASWRPLVAMLVDAGLVDADPGDEARRNILLAPDWKPGDDTHRIAAELTERLHELPVLPGKVGFAIDAGVAPVLDGDPGDFRVERDEAGGLMLRADGRETGVALARGGECDALIAMAHWFVASGGADAGRMARHHAPLPRRWHSSVWPATAGPSLRPGPHDIGSVFGTAFGRVDATSLALMADHSAMVAMRVTPWRMAIVEGIAAGAAWFGEPDPAMIRTDACVGAPACAQASVETRDLARRLAPYVDGSLHVSGCAKGCARQRAADVVLTGQGGRFDLVFGGRAGDRPDRTGLDPDALRTLLGAA